MRLFLSAALACTLTLSVSPALFAGGKSPTISWKKTVVDKTFRSEGVAVADVNRDGKADIIVGDVWYEAPAWKMHPLRKERIKNHVWDPRGYSECFGVFADDLNGDGFPDVMVMPHPGKECFWYENPGKAGGLWKEHLLTTSACNETPIYVDLFKTGKRVLVMAWQPAGKSNMGEMCYFLPESDPTKPWQRFSVSGPSQPGKEIPYTQRYSHGLGAGDVNGDGRPDILCPGGWWEQPAKPGKEPWKFHAVDLGPLCADMHVLDVDGDGKGDVISSSAHLTGIWTHLQRAGAGDPTFQRRELFSNPLALGKIPVSLKATAEESSLFAGLAKARQAGKTAPWRPNPTLFAAARTQTENAGKDYDGKIVVRAEGELSATMNAGEIGKKFLADHPKLKSPALEVGIGVKKSEDGKSKYTILVGDRGLFAQFAQTHALHLVDMNGDGVPDLVTGRRFWAHGPDGDDSPRDPAYIYWFEGRKDAKGNIIFLPRYVDDDSGIGTQFAVADIDGDGIPDIIVSNKRGVYVFVQVRGTAVSSAPPGTPSRRE